MHRGVVIYLIALGTMCSQSAGELVIAPRNTESKVGDTTYFNCSTNLNSEEIFWYHGDKYIYVGSVILDPYQGRFEIERNANKGSHNLVIHSVQPSDAGEYICIDDDGIGTRRSAELVVLEYFPECQSNIQPDGVIGQNIFNIPPDELQLICNVTYYGSIPPQMAWKKVGNNTFIKDSSSATATSTTNLIYTLKLKGDIDIDNTSYVCQTTRATQNQYECKTEVIKVLYFSSHRIIEQKVFRGEEITCSAKGNTFPCINQWHHDNSTFDEKITTHLLGEYLCTGKCHIRKQHYSFEAMKVFVVEATTPPPPSKSGIIAASVVVPIIIIFMAVLIAVNIRRKQRNYQQSVERRMQYEDYVLECCEDYGDQNRFKTSQSERINDKIFEEEVELLYKIKEEATPDETYKIWAVAILKDTLFVVQRNSSKLKVYNLSGNCKDFDKFEILDVNELVDAVDMCSCKRNECLYIMDQKIHGAPKEILRISTYGCVMGKWITLSARSVSATAEGNVIVTVQIRHLLLEYSSDGKLKRLINLICPSPLHAIKRDGGYIVCYGDRDDCLHGVCLVDKEGNVEKSFGHRFGSKENQLHMPQYLAAGSSGCVIVADTNNNRLLLLDSNLEFKAKLVPEKKQRFLRAQVISLSETMLVVQIAAGVPYEEAGESGKETKGSANSIKNNDFLIEKDCRILIFDIRYLLQKYNG